MGSVDDLIVVKLGGSLITEKDRPLQANLKAMHKTAREISAWLSSRRSSGLFLVHGGGSFGHYYAKKFGLSRQYSKVTAEGIAKTSMAMFQLHSLLLGALTEERVYCSTVMISEILNPDGKTISSEGANQIDLILRSRLVPITFGYISQTGRGARIISGDQVLLALSSRFRVKKAIFAMDVDGIFPTSEMNTPILKQVCDTSDLKGSSRKFDVTGGIAAKVEMGLELAKKGADVFFLNGEKKGRLMSVLSGKHDAIATRIYSGFGHVRG